MNSFFTLMTWLSIPGVLRPILPLLGVFFAWRAGRRDGEGARKAARSLSLVLLVGFCVAAATGWSRNRVLDPSIHQWIGGNYFALNMFAIPFAITLTIQQHVRRRPIVTSVQVGTFVFLFAVTLVVSLSGYLGPDRATYDGRVFTEARLNRFLILHIYLMPVIIPLLQIEWWWFFGPVTRADSLKGVVMPLDE